MNSIRTQAKGFRQIGLAARTMAEVAENQRRFVEAMPTAEEFAQRLLHSPLVRSS